MYLSLLSKLSSFTSSTSSVSKDKENQEELFGEDDEEHIPDEKTLAEIEAEVLRRVEEAKKIMEAQMLEELERRKQEQLEEAQRREVRNLLKSSRIRLKSISSSMSCIRRPTQSTKSTYSQK